jgi:ribosomal protein L18
MFDEVKSENRKRRQQRVRKRVRGTDAKPRLCVFRSAKHIYAQVISDDTGKTLVSASTLSSELRAPADNAKKVDAAKQVGMLGSVWNRRSRRSSSTATGFSITAGFERSQTRPAKRD